MNHLYFGPNFVFLSTALAYFSQCFLLIFCRWPTMVANIFTNQFLLTHFYESIFIKNISNSLVAPFFLNHVDCLKEPRNFISRIIHVWSLFCSIRLFASLYFLPILLENYFFILLCFFCCVEFYLIFICIAQSLFIQ